MHSESIPHYSSNVLHFRATPSTQRFVSRHDSICALFQVTGRGRSASHEVVDALMNVAVFMPLGILVPLLVRQPS